MKLPFTTSPLKQFPYNSRTTKNEFSSTSSAKNYILHGFKPGNALQASELNEIQENFYKNLTLHNIMLKNWLFMGAPNFISGSVDVNNVTVPVLGPSWMGCVPLDPFNSITVEGTEITFKPDWYLVDDFSGIKFWIYNNNIQTITFTPTVGEFIGVEIERNYITPAEDNTLFDNSNGFLKSSLSPGADRYQLHIKDTYQNNFRTTASGVKFRDVFRVLPNNRLQYLNNLLYTTQ